MTAKQVRVLPTRSIPEALGALVAYDPEAGADANLAGHGGGRRGHAASGEVTRAVRAAASPAGAVHEGRLDRVVGGRGIVAVGGDLAVAVDRLLDALVGDRHEIVTVIEGEGGDDDTDGACDGWIADHRPEVEVEVHHGGQPLYPYLFGAE